MARYMMKFKKEGNMVYTSHLDLVRLFKRSFKRSDIKLLYSQGFNPHPKMSFAQPLSLGYSSIGELIEFETKDDFRPEFLVDIVNKVLPKGIEIIHCEKLPEKGKSLAALSHSAEYSILIEMSKPIILEEDICERFLGQDKIMIKKKNKKKRDLIDVDIKEKIQELEIRQIDNNIFMSTKLDVGGQSNLSPNLLISAFMTFIGEAYKGESVEILRKKIHI